MTQEPIELILARQLASFLAAPVFLVDVGGNLLYYNEPAEALLGCRYDETGEMSMEEWGSRWTPTDDEGHPIPTEELPLSIAVQKRVLAHGRMRIKGLDGVKRRISVAAFPLEGQAGRQLGAIAVFWEEPS